MVTNFGIFVENGKKRCEKVVFVTYLYNCSGLVFMLDLVDPEAGSGKIWIQIQIKPENGDG